MLADRLELTPLRAGDAGEVHAIMSDPDTWHHRPDGVHTTLAISADWVARAARRWETDGLSYWLARARADGGVVGIGGAQRQATRNWNLHYRLAPAAQGYGYATELSRAAIDTAHELDDSSLVVAWIEDYNIASMRVAERAGLLFRGVFTDPSDGILRRAYTDRPTSTL